MPRVSRHFLPGYLWHITHRCPRRLFKTFNSFNRCASFKTFDEPKNVGFRNGGDRRRYLH